MHIKQMTESFFYAISILSLNFAVNGIALRLPAQYNDRKLHGSVTDFAFFALRRN